MPTRLWLPPFIGPWFLNRTLARGGVDAVARIEELALMQNGQAAAARI